MPFAIIIQVPLSANIKLLKHKRKKIGLVLPIQPRGDSFFSRTPIPPLASPSKKTIPACSKADWIRIRVEARSTEDDYLGCLGL